MRDSLISTADPRAVAALSSATLSAVIDHSMDCVKLIDLEGRIAYMNANGQCAMEVDDFCTIAGEFWADLWPEETRDAIRASYDTVANGGAVRFDAFCPTAKGTPRWWNVSILPVRDAADRHTGYLAVSRDITEAELARQALEIAAAELRHRLKNSYAMIGSLMTSFARGNAEREAFAQDMAGRMVALATAQTMFVADDHAPCAVSHLVPALTAPFDSPSCPVTTRAACDAMVDQGQADAIALVIGELAVNSAKHGALGGTGHVHVTADVIDGRLVILWSERSDRTVTAHARDGGQGLVLMNRIVRARRGTMDVTWFEAGLDARISFAVLPD